jgi:hypothetical protein
MYVSLILDVRGATKFSEVCEDLWRSAKSSLLGNVPFHVMEDGAKGEGARFGGGKSREA